MVSGIFPEPIIKYQSNCVSFLSLFLITTIVKVILNGWVYGEGRRNTEGIMYKVCHEICSPLTLHFL